MDKIIKILDSVLLSICACAVGFGLYRIFEPWLPFCNHHPGIVLVVVGFIGATLFGHEKTTKLRKKLEWWFEMVLLVGLLLEMREAVNEDAKIEGLRRSNEELRQKNDQTEQNLDSLWTHSRARIFQFHADLAAELKGKPTGTMHLTNFYIMLDLRHENEGSAKRPNPDPTL